MAALIKKNELEKYLRTHKCNKTYIVHIKETLRKKHIYEDYMFKIIEAKEYYKINKWLPKGEVEKKW